MKNPIQIGFVLFPRVTQLDLTGPAQVLSRVPGAKVHVVWKAIEPVMTDVGFTINPTTTYAECPQLDVLCVPGGIGVVDQMNEPLTIDFLRGHGATARYVTSVCNGSLLLGAAGLIDGYQSACNWKWLHFLPQFGAEPIKSRVVHDRNRWSGAGVTSGIDFGLSLAAELSDEETAKSIQLGLEYDPQPPFDCGSPEKAGSERVARALAAEAEMQVAVAPVIAQAALRRFMSTPPAQRNPA